MFESHMFSMKDDIKDIKNKQVQIEGQVEETENKLMKKYDEMAYKVGNLESNGSWTISVSPRAGQQLR